MSITPPVRALLLVATFVPGVANAQQQTLHPGVWRVDGSASWMSTSSRTADPNSDFGPAQVTHDVSADATVQRFLSPIFSVGGTVSFRRQTTRDASSSAEARNRLDGAGPIVTFYPASLAHRTVPYVSAYDDEQFGRQELSAGSRLDYRASAYGLRLGALRFLAPQVALDVALDKYWTKARIDQNGTPQSRFRGNALQLDVGVATFIDPAGLHLGSAPSADVRPLDVAEASTLRVAGNVGFGSVTSSAADASGPFGGDATDRALDVDADLALTAARGVALGVVVLVTRDSYSDSGTTRPERSNTTGFGPEITLYPFALASRRAPAWAGIPYLRAFATMDDFTFDAAFANQFGPTYAKERNHGATAGAAVGTIVMFSRHLGADVALEHRWVASHEAFAVDFNPPTDLGPETRLKESSWQLRLGLAAFLKVRPGS